MARSDGYNTKTRQLILDYLIRNRQHAVSASNILEHLEAEGASPNPTTVFTLQCEGSVLYGLCRSCAANEAEDGQAAQTCKNCCADVDTDKKQ